MGILEPKTKEFHCWYCCCFVIAIAVQGTRWLRYLLALRSLIEWMVPDAESDSDIWWFCGLVVSTCYLIVAWFFNWRDILWCVCICSELRGAQWTCTWWWRGVPACAFAWVVLLFLTASLIWRSGIGGWLLLGYCCVGDHPLSDWYNTIAPSLAERLMLASNYLGSHWV